MPAPASPITPGARFGELIVERLYGRRSGARLWLLRCDCGSAVVRSTGELFRSRRLGLTACCRRCLEELRAGRAIERREQTRERLRRLWTERGELYSTSELERIEADIHEAVGQQLGGWRDDADVPGSLCIDPTWLDDRRASAADAPEDGDAPAAPPVLPVEERRARAIDAALARARSPQPAPPPARGRWFDWFSAAS